MDFLPDANNPVLLQDDSHVVPGTTQYLIHLVAASFRQLRPCIPSFFMCPIIGSSALLRLKMFQPSIHPARLTGNENLRTRHSVTVATTVHKFFFLLLSDGSLNLIELNCQQHDHCTNCPKMLDRPLICYFDWSQQHQPPHQIRSCTLCPCKASHVWQSHLSQLTDTKIRNPIGLALEFSHHYGPETHAISSLLPSSDSFDAQIHRCLPSKVTWGTTHT